jgi:hypothetical protein
MFSFSLANIGHKNMEFRTHIDILLCSFSDHGQVLAACGRQTIEKKTAFREWRTYHDDMHLRVPKGHVVILAILVLSAPYRVQKIIVH